MIFRQSNSLIGLYYTCETEILLASVAIRMTVFFTIIIINVINAISLLFFLPHTDTYDMLLPYLLYHVTIRIQRSIYIHSAYINLWPSLLFLFLLNQVSQPRRGKWIIICLRFFQEFEWRSIENESRKLSVMIGFRWPPLEGSSQLEKMILDRHEPPSPAESSFSLDDDGMIILLGILPLPYIHYYLTYLSW